MAKKLYVGNLAFTATEDDVRNAFAAFTVNSVAIISDRETGRSRGFAFIEVEDAEGAIAGMHGKDLSGRKLVVNEARERENRGGGSRPGGFSGGGQGGYGGGNGGQGGGYDRGGNGGGYDRGGYDRHERGNRRDSY